jgi:hypothetical protein
VKVRRVFGKLRRSEGDFQTVYTHEFSVHARCWFLDRTSPPHLECPAYSHHIQHWNLKRTLVTCSLVVAARAPRAPTLWHVAARAPRAPKKRANPRPPLILFPWKTGITRYTITAFLRTVLGLVLHRTPYIFTNSNPVTPFGRSKSWLSQSFNRLSICTSWTPGTEALLVPWVKGPTGGPKAKCPSSIAWYLGRFNDPPTKTCTSF